MKKFMLVVAMLAIVLVAAVPALAQVSNEFSERRVTSGKASPSFAFSNKGNNVNACPVDQQIAQTGNVANEQGALQFESQTGGPFGGDIDFAGSELTVTPSETAECTQTIEQAAAAGPKAEAKAGKAEAKGGAPEAKAGG